MSADHNKLVRQLARQDQAICELQDAYTELSQEHQRSRKRSARHLQQARRDQVQVAEAFGGLWSQTRALCELVLSTLPPYHPACRAAQRLLDGRCRDCGVPLEDWEEEGCNGSGG